MDDRQRYAGGLKKRRKVLGSAHVDRSLANLNPFNADFQSLITRYIWGETWGRGGLDDKMRSRMVLALMMALNRGEEFKLHVRAAFNNGLTPDDIKEVIMFAAPYCGVPAGNHACALAAEVFATMEKEKPGSSGRAGKTVKKPVKRRRR